MSIVNHIGSPRLFVDLPLAAAASVRLDDAQTRHLGAVLRLRAGDPVRLFNGRDGEWLARYARGRRGEAGGLTLDCQLRPQSEGPDCWLLFAPLRRDATELVVEKATELGVSALLPVLTERTQPARLNLARLASIARAAAEQCERLSLPRIEASATLAAVLAGWPPERTLFVAVERALAPPPVRSGAAGALLVGPEGGFASAELELLDHHPFVRRASLGPLVLRAETAAIAGLALLQLARAP